jgi:hypothetical protein
MVLCNSPRTAFKLGLTDRRLGRFASLVMPFCKQDRECPGRGAEFVAMNPGTVDFDDFSKLTVHRVRFDKCPLAVWFWFGKHHSVEPGLRRN